MDSPSSVLAPRSDWPDGRDRPPLPQPAPVRAWFSRRSIRAAAAGSGLWAALAPGLLLLLLGGVELSRHPTLWYDEDYTRLAVTTPLATLLGAVWHTSPMVSWLTVAPSFNAPYYVVMHAWCAAFGVSPLALRLPSLLCSAAAVGVLTRVVRRLGGERAGLTAGLLAASAPLLVRQAIEARSYGMAELAVALTALALVRRVQQGGTRWPLGIAAGASGLLHWFALPVVAGLALGTLVVRRRAGLGDALVLAASSLPAAALVVVQLAGSGDGAPVASQYGLALPVHAVADWSQGAWWLSTALVAAFVVALVRTRARALLVSWAVVPLLIITLVGLTRPMYFDRYMLFTLLGLAAGAALGLASLPGRWSTALSVGLVALSLFACVPRLQSQSLERQAQVVALLESQQTTGQPVAAGDGRAAVELVEEISIEHSRLAGDLVLRPEHVPTDGTATVVWVVRSGSGAALQPSPNDAYLRAGAWTLTTTTVEHGTFGDLTVQKWVR